MEPVQISFLFFVLMICIFGCKGEHNIEDDFLDFYSKECNILEEKKSHSHCELQLMFDEICYSKYRKSRKPVIRLQVSELFEGTKIIRINHGDNCSINTIKETKRNSLYPIYQVNKYKTDLIVDQAMVYKIFEGMADTLPDNVHLNDENYPFYTLEYIDDHTYIRKYKVSCDFSETEMAYLKKVFKNI